MNKTQGGAIGGGIVVAIIIGVTISSIFSSEHSISSDNPTINEEVILDEGGPEGDSVGVNDSYTMDKEVKFYIDEEGKKTYVIEASDSPNLGD